MAKGGNSGGGGPGGGSTTLVITEFGEDTGTFASDGITYDNTITLTGTSTEPAGTIVTIYANGVNLGTATVLGSGDWTFTTTALADGIYDFTAQTGKGKTKQVSDPLTLTIDTTVPDAPTDLTATVLRSGQTRLAWTSSTDDVGIAGYRVYRNDVLLATTAGTTYTVKRARGTFSYFVVAFDAAGNVSAPSATVTVTVR